MKKVTLTILILTMFSATVTGQSKKQHLKENRCDLRDSEFAFPQQDFKIIGFGAYHGSAKTEDAEFALLKSLLQQRLVKYYLPETDFGIAYYLNTYLQTGDTLLLKDLVYHYGERVPQEKSVETYNKWKRIKQLNDPLPQKDQLVVMGIDRIVNYKYTSRHLLTLFGREPVKTGAIAKLINMVETDTTDFSPYYNSYSKRVLQELLDDVTKNREFYENTVNDKALLYHVLDNIRMSFEAQGHNREKIIYDNYMALQSIFHFDKKPHFARFGFSHLEKSREGSNPSFFAMLIENGVYHKDDIVTVMGYLTGSRVLWDVTHDKQGNYSGYTTEGGYGIGDYWKEYFKGIRRLKKTKLSDLTLFRLNQKNSPYRTGEADLIEVQLFLKKSNRELVKGKSTVDFIDYAVLISDSPANIPIQEYD